ncbi:hypothetical protein SAMN04488003_10571 [Loktanella fryxellensis]|uniref:NADH dehydrogenase subunit E n=1 Tax=Loktanella fryxellensis TaxID=245187 RepID=A0A1H8BJE0_9RHOB|nr:DUF5333 domain-containing protein [Loktanella fryxellensis]SEM83020.1 hypothetical protein SAMN04488003_10571 [Loktanella fryxellensis]
MPRPLILGAILAAVAAPVAQAQSLADESEIRNGLLVVGMAYELSEKCGPVDARTVRGISTLLNLKSRARALGYSNAEIDAYIDDEAEKDRLEVIARSQLEQLGAVPGQEDTYCAVARDQIARGTGVGRLLR